MSENVIGPGALWPQMISALAAIDDALGLEQDGCNSTEATLTAIKLLKSAHRDDVAEIERLRGEWNIARIDLANMAMRLRHRDAEIAELRAELTTAEAALESLQNKWASRPLSVEDTAALERENDALRAELAKTQCAVGDTPDSWAALVRDAAIGRWLLSQAEDYDGHACFPDVPYMCPDLRESVEAAMKEQQP